eukprot:SAG31_NODE_1659_length_7602_cov_7.696122_5_plen_117_part_00
MVEIKSLRMLPRAAQVLSTVDEFRECCLSVASTSASTCGEARSGGDGSKFVQRLGHLFENLARPHGTAENNKLTVSAELIAEMLGTVGVQHDPQELLQKVLAAVQQQCIMVSQQTH